MWVSIWVASRMASQSGRDILGARQSTAARRSRERQVRGTTASQNRDHPESLEEIRAKIAEEQAETARLEAKRQWYEEIAAMKDESARLHERTTGVEAHRAQLNAEADQLERRRGLLSGRTTRLWRRKQVAPGVRVNPFEVRPERYARTEGRARHLRAEGHDGDGRPSGDWRVAPAAQAKGLGTTHRDDHLGAPERTHGGPESGAGVTGPGGAMRLDQRGRPMGQAHRPDR